MIDIVGLLRSHEAPWGYQSDLAWEAAAEIERLRALNAELLAALKEIERWVEARPKEHPFDTWQKVRAAIEKAEGNGP